MTETVREWVERRIASLKDEIRNLEELRDSRDNPYVGSAISQHKRAVCELDAVLLVLDRQGEVK